MFLSEILAIVILSYIGTTLLGVKLMRRWYLLEGGRWNSQLQSILLVFGPFSLFLGIVFNVGWWLERKLS